MIYPMGGAFLNTDEATHNLYRKTHGNFGPGEQKLRNYEWKLNPAEHRFGFAEKKNLNGAQKALQAERLEEEFPKTVIVKQTLGDFKAVSSDILGVSKNLGQGQTDRGKNFVHGIANVQGEDTWNAARCIHGEPTADTIAPDHDLGKSVRRNCRNLVRRNEDAHRSFGLPTVRNDIPLKAFKGVADFQVSFIVTD